MSIETTILAQDKRGIAALRPHLSPHYCTDTAQFLLDHAGTVFIATGFYILKAHAPETEGPPGALALGNALTSLGRRVVYISDQYTTPLLKHLAAPTAECIDFPIADVQTSQQYAAELLTQFDPGMVIAIERCGLTQVGTYLNMRGNDISATTARLDELFIQHPHSIGIGDGGNEIGMGNLAPYIPCIDTLPDMPAITRTTHLVIASVANWGAYGLIAALSALVDQNLLPAPDAETALIQRAVAFGAVDGINSQQAPTVDGFSLAQNEAVLTRLHSWLRA